jgi:peroxiredoxin
MLLSPFSGCVGDDSSEEIDAVDSITDLTAPNQHGDNVTLTEFRGSMLVILFNAADWCGVCNDEANRTEELLQSMEVLDDRYTVSFVELLRDNAEGTSIASQEDAMNWSVYSNNSHSVLHGQDVRDYIEETFDREDIPGFPSYLIVDLDGVARSWVVGTNEPIVAEDVRVQYEAYLQDLEQN